MTNDEGKLRLFISIGIPEAIKKSILKRITRINVRNIAGFRWMPEENWHITLSFLEDQEKEKIPAILDAMGGIRDVTGGKGAEIKFKKFAYGPPGRRDARMLWLEASEETTQTIRKMKDRLEKALEANGIIWRKDERIVAKHITLARFPFTPVFRLPPLPGDFSEKFHSAAAELVA